jgi:phage tail-like protein
MAAPTNVATTLIDPFLNFRYVVYLNGTAVAAVSKVGALSRTTQVVSWREGGLPQGMRRLPGQTEYGPVTLERGITLDVAFEQWANKVWYYPQSSGTAASPANPVSLADFRQSLNIQLMNQTGQPVLSYWVFNCWPSEYKALPDLDGTGNAVALESLTLQNEGWVRDDTLTAPTAVSILQPSSSSPTYFTSSGS